LKTAVKAKMLTFMLPTEKYLIVSFLIFLQIYRQPQQIWKDQNHQKFLLSRCILSKLDNPLFCFKVHNLLHNNPAGQYLHLEVVTCIMLWGWRCWHLTDCDWPKAGDQFIEVQILPFDLLLW